METSVISYPGEENSQVVGLGMPMNVRFQKTVNLGRQNPTGYVTITIEKKDMDYLIAQVNFRNHISEIKEGYCFTAINNLVKKTEYLQLSLQLAENLISEDEFEAELESFPEKYVIKLNDIESPAHLHIIGGLLGKLGRQFTVDEVSELFSIDTRSINNSLAVIGHKNI